MQDQSIGDRIRIRRRAMELTQENVAQLLSHDPSDLRKFRARDVSGWERGTVPSTPMIMPICRALGVEPQWLLEGTGPITR